MHKNIEVAELVIDEAAVAIIEIGKVHALEHLPLGVYNLKGNIDRRERGQALYEFWFCP
jgi:hypothetical protein